MDQTKLTANSRKSKKSTNSEVQVKLAEKAVDQSSAQFERAMDHLADKVGETSAKVQQVQSKVQHAQNVVQEQKDRIAMAKEKMASAIDNGLDTSRSYYSRASTRIRPFYAQASTTVRPYYEQASVTVRPYFDRAAGFSRQIVHGARENPRPYAYGAAGLFSSLVAYRLYRSWSWRRLERRTDPHMFEGIGVL